MRLILLVVCVLCMGAKCTKEDPPPLCRPGTDVQLQTVVRYVAIAPELTAPVEDTSGEIGPQTTNNEAVQTGLKAKALLAQCNGRLNSIETVEGTDKP